MEFTASDDPVRLDRDWIWLMLSTEVYWHRWRTRPTVERQIDDAWRVVGIYDRRTDRQLGFARAVSDGVNDAYLADVVVDPGARGRGVGKLLIRTMIDDGPGSRFRWTLFTADAHGLYEQFGFADPGPTAMVRPGRPPEPADPVDGTAATGQRAMAAEAVDHANTGQATDWRLVGRLAGGVQSGAWRIEGPDGSPAVLKLALTADWADRMIGAAASVERARSAGYPTPAWLSTGRLRSGIGYQIQELVAGQSVDRIGTAEARALTEVLESQAGIDPAPARNWNDFLADDLTGGLGDLRRSAAGNGAVGRNLIEVCERLLAPSVDWAAVPRADLVHGDFRPANVLLDDGRVTGVIDIEAVGSGTRAFDYATLLDHPDIDPDALELIVTAGAEAAGRDVLMACFARVALDLVRFLQQRHPGPDPERSHRIEQLTERARTIERMSRTLNSRGTG